MNQLQRLLAIHGVGGVLKIVWAKFIGLALYLTAARRRARAAVREKDLAFDRRFGVDTAGLVIPAESDVIGASWAYGSRYQGIDVDSLEQTLHDLQIDFRQFSFIDMGSGKGRAVLAASRYPFANVIGVEYSAQLHAAAQQNLDRFPKEEVRCGNLELICDDATRFGLPSGPIVLFLYNPFGEVVMKEVVANVERSLQEESRRVIVLYFYSVAAEVWKNSTFMSEMKSSQWLSIYDSEPIAAEPAESIAA